MTDASPTAQINAQFEALKTAQANAPTADLTLRRKWLGQLSHFLTKFEPDLIAAMQADFTHRSHTECLNLDIATSMSQVRYAQRHVRRWMRKRFVPTPLAFLPARAHLHPQARGVVGIMAPWNFPVYLAIAPLAAALAAGNRVMIKPSELAPHTSSVLAKGLAQCMDADVVTVILGDAQTAAAFSSIPFDHLLFTGSTDVGRKVALAAAQNLTPVTLELGGKSPAIVMPSADLDRAARRIAWGKTSNGGQICVAPDYALVPRAQVAEFANKIEAVWKEFYPQGAASPDYCGNISERHLVRLENMLSEAQTNGARMVQLDAGQIPKGQRKIAPALVIDPPLESAVMREEIFGPILPIIPYDTPKDALGFVTARDHPLALYVFAEDRAEQEIWINQSLSGGVAINDTVIHVALDTLPFGGVGASGYGAYHGRAGFDTFSHLKPVLRQAKWNAMGLTEPPITRRKSRLLEFARRFM